MLTAHTHRDGAPQSTNTPLVAKTPTLQGRDTTHLGQRACPATHSRQTLVSTTALHWKVISNLPRYLPLGTVLDSICTAKATARSTLSSTALQPAPAPLLPQPCRVTLPWGPGPGGEALESSSTADSHCREMWGSLGEQFGLVPAAEPHKSHSCFSRRWKPDCQTPEHLTELSAA